MMAMDGDPRLKSGISEQNNQQPHQQNTSSSASLPAATVVMSIVPAPLDSYPQTCPSAGPGYPGNLNAEQEAKLKQIKEELTKEGYTERTDDASMVRSTQDHTDDSSASFARENSIFLWPRRCL